MPLIPYAPPLASGGWDGEVAFVIPVVVLAGCILGRCVAGKVVSFFVSRRNQVKVLSVFLTCVAASTTALALTILLPAFLIGGSSHWWTYSVLLAVCVSLVVGLYAGVRAERRSLKGSGVSPSPAVPRPRVTYHLAELLIVVGFLAIWLLAWSFGKGTFPPEDVPLLVPDLTFLSWASDRFLLTPTVVIVSCVASVLIAFVCFIDVVRFMDSGRDPDDRRKFLILFLVLSWIVAPFLLLGWSGWAAARSSVAERLARQKAEHTSDGTNNSKY
jgi:hypothetical protein